MVDAVPVDLFLTRLKESCWRHTLQFIEGSHLAAIGQGAVVIGIHGVPAEGRFGGIPLLVEIAGLGVDLLLF